MKLCRLVKTKVSEGHFCWHNSAVNWINYHCILFRSRPFISQLSVLWFSCI